MNRNALPLIMAACAAVVLVLIYIVVTGANP